MYQVNLLFGFLIFLACMVAALVKNISTDGFTFMVCSGSVHDGALDFSQYATGALPIQLINAWTEEDAKKKYLKINETQRMYDFEDEFAGYVLWGDIYEITTPLKNGENIKKTADRILKYLFPENKVYSIDMNIISD